MAAANSDSSFSKNVRPPIESYTKSKWDEYFISFSLDHRVQEKSREVIEALKEEAKNMLMADGDTKARKLVLIDTLERLGVAYHFDQEIEEQLGQTFKSHCENMNEEEDTSNLFITSLQFRLFRQHRFPISCGVFDKFIGTDKKFKESCIDDAKGLLSLYEAAHLRTHGEPILDEAVAFTVHHLKRVVQQLEPESSSPLQDQVMRALEIPLHRRMSRIETRYYISMYEKDDSKNNVLLKLARLDFNYLQNMHKKELCELTRWWSELKLKSKFSYARSRVVEAYLWATSHSSEPHEYSYVRMAVTRIFQILTIIDDTYDNYATVEEADLFNAILQRWNIDEIDQIPDYMKPVYRLILSEYDVYECDAAEKGKMFSVPYAKETVKQDCDAYNKELKWTTGQEMPSFEEYMVSSVITAGFYVLCSRTIPGMISVTKENIDWLQSEPKIVVATSIVGRYLNNMSGHQRESKQGLILTGFDFYMKQNGASVQETAEKFIELVEDAWKDINAELMVKNSQVPKEIMEQVLGYARAAEVFYRSFKDGYTRTELLAPYIAALFIDPIII